MKVIYHKNLKEKFINPVVCIGVFDGVHFGHRKIIKSVVRKAKKIHGQSIVVTFWPHPHKEKIIYSLSHRLKVIEELGADVCVVIEFDNFFAKVSAADFVEEFLVKKIGIKYLFVGDNFRFGKFAEGDVAFLKDLALKNKFGLKIFKVVLKNNHFVSSTNIRKLICSGQIKKAQMLLMRPVSVMGDVVYGTGIAKTLGFPTANINPHHEIVPPAGIYACIVFLNKKKYKGICYVGSKPTFIEGSKDVNIEVHIFNFKRNLYGATIEVQFLKKIRNEMKFPTSEQLKVQIKKDILKAEKIIKG